MYDRTDELTRLVADSMDDIIFDHVNYDVPVQTEIKMKELRVRDVWVDDGVVWGTYCISVNGGRFEIDLTAQATVAGFEDHWDWASEAHYTTDVEFAEPRDFEYKVTTFRMDNDRALDRMVDADIDSKEEELQ